MPKLQVPEPALITNALPRAFNKERSGKISGFLRIYHKLLQKLKGRKYDKITASVCARFNLRCMHIIKNHKTPEIYLEAIRTRLLPDYHASNCEAAKEYGKYPFTETFKEILILYTKMELKSSVVNAPDRITRTLMNIFYDIAEFDKNVEDVRCMSVVATIQILQQIDGYQHIKNSMLKKLAIKLGSPVLNKIFETCEGKNLYECKKEIPMDHPDLLKIRKAVEVFNSWFPNYIEIEDDDIEFVPTYEENCKMETASNVKEELIMVKEEQPKQVGLVDLTSDNPEVSLSWEVRTDMRKRCNQKAYNCTGTTILSKSSPSRRSMKVQESKDSDVMCISDDDVEIVCVERIDSNAKQLPHVKSENNVDVSEIVCSNNTIAIASNVQDRENELFLSSKQKAIHNNDITIDNISGKEKACDPEIIVVNQCERKQFFKEDVIILDDGENEQIETNHTFPEQSLDEKANNDPVQQTVDNLVESDAASFVSVRELKTDENRHALSEPEVITDQELNIDSVQNETQTIQETPCSLEPSAPEIEASLVEPLVNEPQTEMLDHENHSSNELDTEQNVECPTETASVEIIEPEFEQIQSPKEIAIQPEETEKETEDAAVVIEEAAEIVEETIVIVDEPVSSSKSTKHLEDLSQIVVEEDSASETAIELADHRTPQEGVTTEQIHIETGETETIEEQKSDRSNEIHIETETIEEQKYDRSNEIHIETETIEEQKYDRSNEMTSKTAVSSQEHVLETSHIEIVQEQETNEINHFDNVEESVIENITELSSEKTNFDCGFSKQSPEESEFNTEEGDSQESVDTVSSSEQTLQEIKLSLQRQQKIDTEIPKSDAFPEQVSKTHSHKKTISSTKRSPPRISQQKEKHAKICKGKDTDKKEVSKGDKYSSRNHRESDSSKYKSRESGSKRRHSERGDADTRKEKRRSSQDHKDSDDSHKKDKAPSRKYHRRDSPKGREKSDRSTRESDTTLNRVHKKQNSSSKSEYKFKEERDKATSPTVLDEFEDFLSSPNKKHAEKSDNDTIYSDISEGSFDLDSDDEIKSKTGKRSSTEKENSRKIQRDKDNSNKNSKKHPSASARRAKSYDRVTHESSSSKSKRSNTVDRTIDLKNRLQDRRSDKKRQERSRRGEESKNHEHRHHSPSPRKRSVDKSSPTTSGEHRDGQSKRKQDDSQDTKLNAPPKKSETDCRSVEKTASVIVSVPLVEPDESTNKIVQDLKTHKTQLVDGIGTNSDAPIVSPPELTKNGQDILEKKKSRRRSICPTNQQVEDTNIIEKEENVLDLQATEKCTFLIPVESIAPLHENQELSLSTRQDSGVSKKVQNEVDESVSHDVQFREKPVASIPSEKTHEASTSDQPERVVDIPCTHHSPMRNTELEVAAAISEEQTEQVALPISKDNGDSGVNDNSEQEKITVESNKQEESEPKCISESDKAQPAQDSETDSTRTSAIVTNEESHYYKSGLDMLADTADVVGRGCVVQPTSLLNQDINQAFTRNYIHQEEKFLSINKKTKHIESDSSDNSDCGLTIDASTPGRDDESSRSPHPTAHFEEKTAKPCKTTDHSIMTILTKDTKNRSPEQVQKKKQASMYLRQRQQSLAVDLSQKPPCQPATCSGVEPLKVRTKAERKEAQMFPMTISYSTENNKAATSNTPSPRSRKRKGMSPSKRTQMKPQHDDFEIPVAILTEKMSDDVIAEIPKKRRRASSQNSDVQMKSKKNQQKGPNKDKLFKRENVNKLVEAITACAKTSDITGGNSKKTLEVEESWTKEIAPFELPAKTKSKSKKNKANEVKQRKGVVASVEKEILTSKMPPKKRETRKSFEAIMSTQELPIVAVNRETIDVCSSEEPKVLTKTPKSRNKPPKRPVQSCRRSPRHAYRSSSTEELQISYEAERPEAEDVKLKVEAGKNNKKRAKKSKSKVSLKTEDGTMPTDSNANAKDFVEKNSQEFVAEEKLELTAKEVEKGESDIIGMTSEETNLKSKEIVDESITLEADKAKDNEESNADLPARKGGVLSVPEVVPPEDTSQETDIEKETVALGLMKESDTTTEQTEHEIVISGSSPSAKDTTHVDRRETKDDLIEVPEVVPTEDKSQKIDIENESVALDLMKEKDTTTEQTVHEVAVPLLSPSAEDAAQVPESETRDDLISVSEVVLPKDTSQKTDIEKESVALDSVIEKDTTTEQIGHEIAIPVSSPSAEDLVHFDTRETGDDPIKVPEVIPLEDTSQKTDIEKESVAVDLMKEKGTTTEQTGHETAIPVSSASTEDSAHVDKRERGDDLIKVPEVVLPEDTSQKTGIEKETVALDLMKENDTTTEQIGHEIAIPVASPSAEDTACVDKRETRDDLIKVPEVVPPADTSQKINIKKESVALDLMKEQDITTEQTEHEITIPLLSASVQDTAQVAIGETRDDLIEVPEVVPAEDTSQKIDIEKDSVAVQLIKERDTTTEQKGHEIASPVSSPCAEDAVHFDKRERGDDLIRVSEVVPPEDATQKTNIEKETVAVDVMKEKDITTEQIGYGIAIPVPSPSAKDTTDVDKRETRDDLIETREKLERRDELVAEQKTMHSEQTQLYNSPINDTKKVVEVNSHDVKCNTLGGNRQSEKEHEKLDLDNKTFSSSSNDEVFDALKISSTFTNNSNPPKTSNTEKQLSVKNSKSKSETSLSPSSVDISKAKSNLLKRSEDNCAHKSLKMPKKRSADYHFDEYNAKYPRTNASASLKNPPATPTAPHEVKSLKSNEMEQSPAPGASEVEIVTVIEMVPNPEPTAQENYTNLEPPGNESFAEKARETCTNETLKSLPEEIPLPTGITATVPSTLTTSLTEFTQNILPTIPDPSSNSIQDLFTSLCSSLSTAASFKPIDTLATTGTMHFTESGSVLEVDNLCRSEKVPVSQNYTETKVLYEPVSSLMSITATTVSASTSVMSSSHMLVKPSASCDFVTHDPIAALDFVNEIDYDPFVLEDVEIPLTENTKQSDEDTQQCHSLGPFMGPIEQKTKTSSNDDLTTLPEEKNKIFNKTTTDITDEPQTDLEDNSPLDTVVAFPSASVPFANEFFAENNQEPCGTNQVSVSEATYPLINSDNAAQKFQLVGEKELKDLLSQVESTGEPLAGYLSSFSEQIGADTNPSVEEQCDTGHYVINTNASFLPPQLTAEVEPPEPPAPVTEFKRIVLKDYSSVQETASVERKSPIENAKRLKAEASPKPPAYGTRKRRKSSVDQHSTGEIENKINYVINALLKVNEEAKSNQKTVECSTSDGVNVKKTFPTIDNGEAKVRKDAANVEISDIPLPHSPPPPKLEKYYEIPQGRASLEDLRNEKHPTVPAAKKRPEMVTARQTNNADGERKPLRPTRRGSLHTDDVLRRSVQEKESTIKMDTLYVRQAGFTRPPTSGKKNKHSPLSEDTIGPKLNNEMKKVDVFETASLKFDALLRGSVEEKGKNSSNVGKSPLHQKLDDCSKKFMNPPPEPKLENKNDALKQSMSKQNTKRCSPYEPRRAIPSLSSNADSASKKFDLLKNSENSNVHKKRIAILPSNKIDPKYLRTSAASMGRDKVPAVTVPTHKRASNHYGTPTTDSSSNRTYGIQLPARSKSEHVRSDTRSPRVNPDLFRPLQKHDGQSAGTSTSDDTSWIEGMGVFKKYLKLPENVEFPTRSENNNESSRT